MAQRLHGRKLFGVPISGSLATMRNPGAGSILIARKLTPAVVRALTDTHVAVLTCSGGFACHGANVLRVVRRSRLSNITWVTELPEGIIFISPGTYCEISADGTVLVDSGEPIKIHQKESVSELFGLLSSGTRIRCYWPDRVYDRFSASMMIPGLSEDMRELGFDGTAIHGPDRLIWFRGNSPTSDELLNYAQFSSDLCWRTVDRQLNVYSMIVSELQAFDCNNGSLDTLVSICKAYFSCFLLHHRTYSNVLSRALETLGDLVQREDNARSIVEGLFGTELVQWYSSLPFTLSVRKDFVEEPFIIPLPEFSPKEEITRAEGRLELSIRQMNLSHSTHETLCKIARLCILKEWKFVLNKLITSRVAERLRRLSIDSELIRMLTIEEVLAANYASEKYYRLH